MIKIEFLEKTSTRRLLLSWRENGRCNYTEQLWSLRKAPNLAVCALSGETIRRGDHVYRPVGHPLNHDKCIRADVIQFS